MVLLLTGLSAAGGFAPRHPFDLAWDYGVRHLMRAPALPPNSRRRRRAWRVATIVLLAVAGLLAVDATTAGLVLGFATATSFNLCIPSELVAWRERRGGQRSGAIGSTAPDCEAPKDERTSPLPKWICHSCAVLFSRPTRASRGLRRL
jgi:hypothetical protein